MLYARMPRSRHPEDAAEDTCNFSYTGLLPYFFFRRLALASRESSVRLSRLALLPPYRHLPRFLVGHCSTMDRDKLMKMAGAVRTGGKGSVRRCGGWRRGRESLLSTAAGGHRGLPARLQKEEGRAQDDLHR